MSDQDLVRYLVYRYRFNHHPRAKRLLDFPLLLAIEPTSICNLRCIMCFQDDPRLSRNRELLGRMDFDLYRRIIDEGARHGLAAVVLASRGEPMLHDRIFDMIRYAKAAGILDVKMNTNATRLTPERSRALLGCGLDTLVFSVDAATKEDFERIRVRANFDKVVANIDAFNAIRKDEFSDIPLRTRISMVVIDERQDVARAEAFWAARVDEFAVRSAIPRVGIYEQAPLETTRACSLLWERLYVWWDGTVNPCDEDYLSRLAIGNVADGDTIAGLWRGAAMTRYRRAHTARQKHCLSPCDRCPGF
jgi:radical SAM protein with 4Fe4S-binding SPASM domain